MSRLPGPHLKPGCHPDIPCLCAGWTPNPKALICFCPSYSPVLQRWLLHPCGVPRSGLDTQDHTGQRPPGLRPHQLLPNTAHGSFRGLLLPSQPLWNHSAGRSRDHRLGPGPRKKVSPSGLFPQVAGDQLIYENWLVSGIHVRKGPQGSITRDSTFQ